MSLHARIAIVPSRAVAVARAIAIGGGVAVAGATLAARLDSAAVEFAAAVCAVVGAVLAFRSRPVDPTSLFVGDGAALEVAVADASPESARIADGTLRWPGFAVLRLVPAQGGGGRARDIVVVESALGVDDAWRLRRWLVWLAGAVDRSLPTVDRRS